MPTPSTPAKSGPLAADFNRLDGERSERLETVETCARLTFPSVLPSEQRRRQASDDERLDRNYQSVGTRGVGQLTGILHSAFYGPPWLTTELPPKFEYDPAIPAELKQDIMDRAALRDATVLGLIESGHAHITGNSRPLGFLSQSYQEVRNLLVAGDSLKQITDDFAIKVYRMDRYVTERDSSTAVLQHGVIEYMDPLSLSEEQFMKTGLDLKELEKMPVSDRIAPLYTFTRWQPRSRVWTVIQEMNGKEIESRDEQISCFIGTPYDLTSGEHYGRGFVEQNLGDLESLDELCQRLLQNAELATRIHPIVDPASAIKPQMLQRAKSGTVFTDRVQGGSPVNLGIWKIDKINDFQVGFQNVQRLETNLNRAFLILSETMPRGDRVTATAINVVGKEKDDATTGLAATISEESLLPLGRKAYEIAERKSMVAPLSIPGVRVTVLTGKRALQRQQRLQSVLTIAGIVQSMGPEAAARLDMNVLVSIVARYGGLLEEPGLIKTPEQMAREQQEAQRQAAITAANEQMIQSVGRIAETAAQGAVGQTLPTG